MTWFTIASPGTSNVNTFFGDTMNKINNMFNGVNISDTVNINSNVTWVFNSLLTLNNNLSMSGTINTHTIPSGTGTFTLDGHTHLKADITDFVHNHQNAAEGGQLDSTLALSDTDDIAYINTSNTYIAGNKQSFVANSTTASINLNAQLPSALVAGDIYRTAEVLHFIGTTDTDYILVSDGQPTTYTAGVRQNFLGSLAGTSGLNVGEIAGNPSTQIDGDIWLNTSSNTLFARIDGVNVDLGTTVMVGGGNTFARVVKKVDESVFNDSVFHDDNELFVTLNANRHYGFLLSIIFNSNGLADFKFTWSVPSAADGRQTNGALSSGGTVASTITTSIIALGSGLDAISTIEGRISTSTSSGVAQLRWAQNIIDASTTIVKRGSYLIVWEE